MNNVTPDRKENILKTLAIIGLLGVIIFIAWVSVQIVSVIPSAVNSLASLADSVYSYDPKGIKEIDLKPIPGPVSTGDRVIISWDRPLQTGFYAFNYKCADGLSIEIKTSESDFENAACDTSYNLGSVETAELVINSEKKPELEVAYSVSYFKTNDSKPAAEITHSVLVTNPRFYTETTNETTSTEVTVNDETITEPEPEVTTTEDSPTTGAAPVPAKPITTYEYVYTLPVSNPNGFTDLAVSYKGIGRTDSSGTFTNTGVLYLNTAGAVQFTVQNIGTKTSNGWYFSASLPGERTFKSKEQTPLKPNERATLNFAFPGVSSTDLQTFSIEIETTNDNNSKNDSISWSAVVIK